MRAGQQITPTLELVRQLGQGGMGEVWVAKHLALGVDVAVKFRANAASDDPRLVARFRQEAQAAAEIKSPHVAQVFDHGVTAEGAPYIVMELLEGETLHARLQERGALPVGEVVRIVGQTAKALSRAHKLGIVHRDIKPENLFLIDVDGEPFVKVLDFGIAKVVDDDTPGLTSTGRTMGTAYYMSPEQFRDAKHVDHRADLWSLGVVAYQALAGKLPFSGNGFGALAVAVHTGEVTPPSRLQPGLPPGVDAWMARVLQRDPAARFDTAKEMAEALRHVAGTTGPWRAHGGTPAHAAVVLAATAPAPAPVEAKMPEPAAPCELKIGGRRIRIDQGEIERAGTDAIVSPTEPDLFGSGPVGRAIHRAAGSEIHQMLSPFGRCPPGCALITGAGRIPPPTRFIIHAVPPLYSLASVAECERLLRCAHLISLRLAEQSELRSVAFSALNRGGGHHPYQKLASVAIDVAVQHLSSAARSVELIVFVLRTGGGDSASRDAFEEALAARARR